MSVKEWCISGTTRSLAFRSAESSICRLCEADLISQTTMVSFMITSNFRFRHQGTELIEANYHRKSHQNAKISLDSLPATSNAR